MDIFCDRCLDWKRGNSDYLMKEGVYFIYVFGFNCVEARCELHRQAIQAKEGWKEISREEYIVGSVMGS